MRFRSGEYTNLTCCQVWYNIKGEIVAWSDDVSLTAYGTVEEFCTEMAKIMKAHEKSVLYQEDLPAVQTPVSGPVWMDFSEGAPGGTIT